MADPFPSSQHLQPTLGYFELPDLERKGMHNGTHTCSICGAHYTDGWLLRQHQVDLGHFNTDKHEEKEEVVRRQQKEEQIRSQTLRRLEGEISGASMTSD